MEKEYHNRVIPVVGEAYNNRNYFFQELRQTWRIADAISRVAPESKFFIRSEPDAKDLAQQLENQMLDLAPQIEIVSEIPEDLTIAFGGQNLLDQKLNCPRIVGVAANNTVLACLLIKDSKIQEDLFWTEPTDLQLLDITSLSFHLMKLVCDPKNADPQLLKIYEENGEAALIQYDAYWTNPWSVWSVAPKKIDLESTHAHLPELPYEMVRNAHVLFIGCGTASLAAGELIRFVDTLSFVDPKEFSIFNVVRQWVTRQVLENPRLKEIRKKKAIMLAETILQQKDLGVRNPSIVPAYESDTPNTYAFAPFTTNLASHKEVWGFVKEIKTEEDVYEILDRIPPVSLVIVGMGETHGVNHVVCNALRKRKIPHIVPSALPSAKYHKIIVVDPEKRSPCYSCYQRQNVIDRHGPSLSETEREVFYGGTQPATLFETRPSAHAVVRTALDMLIRKYRKDLWIDVAIEENRACFLWANKTEEERPGKFLYGVERVGAMYSFNVRQLREPAACKVCGRLNGDRFLSPCIFCGEKESSIEDRFCSIAHKMAWELKLKRQEQQKRNEEELIEEGL